MFKEFKEFITKGNAFDLAVGIVIGAAFGGIITSLVKDILMPPIGLLLGKVDFSNLFVVLAGMRQATLAETQAAGAVTMNYGLFINTIINFLIVGFAIFLMIRQVNKIRKPAEAPATKDCPHCYSAIPEKATRCPDCTSELS